MFNYACVPHVGNTQLLDALQRFGIDVTEFADTVFLQCNKGFVGGVGISKQARHHLVDDHLLLGWGCNGRIGNFVLGWLAGRQRQQYNRNR